MKYKLQVHLISGKWETWNTYKTEKAAKQGRKVFIKKFIKPVFMDIFRKTKPRIISK